MDYAVFSPGFRTSADHATAHPPSAAGGENTIMAVLGSVRSKETDIVRVHMYSASFGLMRERVLVHYASRQVNLWLV